MLDEKYGYLHSCPTNLGTGMRASVHIDLPGWTKEGLDALKKRCEELKLQPRGTRGESGGQTGVTYDISNKHRFVAHFFSCVVMMMEMLMKYCLLMNLVSALQIRLLWSRIGAVHDRWRQRPLRRGLGTPKEARWSRWISKWKITTIHSLIADPVTLASHFTKNNNQIQPSSKARKFYFYAQSNLSLILPNDVTYLITPIGFTIGTYSIKI